LTSVRPPPSGLLCFRRTHAIGRLRAGARRDRISLRLRPSGAKRAPLPEKAGEAGKCPRSRTMPVYGLTC